MNKKFTRLTAALALLTFLIPITGWGQTTWTRVTSVDDLLAGGTFILGYEATANSGTIIPMQNQGTATTSSAGYMYSGTTSGSTGSGSINMSTVTSTSLYEVTIVASTKVDGAICIKIGDNFLGNTDTKNNCKLFTSESKTTAFTPTAKTNSTFELKIAENTTYYDLQYNSGSPRFAVYGGTQKHPVIYKKEVSGDVPTITADPVTIGYNETSGSITYTIDPATGASITSAVVTTSNPSGWLTVNGSSPYTSPISLSCEANNTASEKTATVTLTCTYGDNQTTTKTVAVTQAGNPNIVDNISNITAAGNYTVQGTIVAISTRGFVLGDGTGYVYYYYGNNFTYSSYSIGDIVRISGEVTASTSYKVFQFTSSAGVTEAQTSNYQTENPTVLTGSQMDAVVASTNTTVTLSNYIQYEGTLTVTTNNNNTYYNITSIDGATTAKGSISYPTNTDFTSLNGKTVTVMGYFVGVSSSQYYNTMIGSIEEVVSTDPLIEAESSYELAYDATQGAIPFTVQNPVDGGQLAVLENAEWISDAEIAATPTGYAVNFTCVANPNAAPRETTITITYTYGTRTVVGKEVSVTQAGNPNVFDNISDITTSGNAYSVRGTVVATNAKGFVIGDGTGYVYTYLNAAPTQAVGGMVTVSGTMGDHNHVLQFTSSASIAEATASSYTANTPAATEITTIPDYTLGNHLSTYLQFEGALTQSNNNYFVALGSSSIQISYPTSGQGTALTALKDKNVLVKGYFAGYNTNNYFTVMLESVEEVTSTDPSITLSYYNTNEHPYTPSSAYSIVFPSDPVGGDIDLVECVNFTASQFTIQFYNDQNETIEKPSWIQYAQVNSENETYVLYVTAFGNEGDEARTTYFKVCANNGDTPVYSDLVTVTQAAYVIDYATLPFGYEGGVLADFSALNGTSYSLNDNGSYAESNAPYRIKFTKTGDYLQVKTNERPGIVSVGVKVFNTGTTDSKITVQGSADGETFTNIQELTISASTTGTSTLTTTNSFGENYRYVRLYFTKGVNVGVGPISIAKYVAPAPTITVEPATLNVDYTAHNGTLTATLSNFTVSSLDEFDIQFYDENNQELSGNDKPTWISFGDFTVNEDVYSVSYTIGANNDDERTAYLKIYTITDEVYSNLVTVTQAAAPTPALYSYSVNGVEDEPYQATVGQIVTLSYGQGLNEDFSFVGWTTNPNDVSIRMPGGTEYELTDEVTVFYAVYAHTVTSEPTEAVVILDGNAPELTSNAQALNLSENGFTYYASSAKYQALGSEPENNISTGKAILIGKKDAYLRNTTAFGDGITKFEIYANKGAAAAATAGVYFSTSEISAYTTGDNTWVSDSDGMGSDQLHDASSAIPSGAKYFWYQVTNDKNTQVQFRITYTTTGSVTTYYTRVFLNETLTDDLVINGPSIIPSGSVLDMDGNDLSNPQANIANLVIEDGGQVILDEANSDVYARVQKNIIGFGEGNGNWYLLSAPSHDVLNANPLYPEDCPIANLMPADQTVNDETVHMFDLYKFDQTKEEEWQNFRQPIASKSFIYQEGRLYARKESATLEFNVKLATYTNEDRIYYYEDNDFAGWSLIGNAMMCNQYVALFTGTHNYETTDYYRMNAAGTALELCENGAPVAPMEGIFVQTTNSTEEVYVQFSSTPIDTKSSAIDLNVSFNNAITDRARVRFGEGSVLGKFNFNENATKLYIPQGNEDYAVVRSANEGEMPVSFKASKNGTYTISVEPKNVEMTYLHLIDNMTGADVDLLATPSYSFEARTTDYASRFRLVFNANNGSNENGNETFAYYNGSEWMINNMGDATLQVVDVMGRVLSTETVSGNATINLNQTPGVYMLRLVNGDSVKVQKVVVR